MKRLLFILALSLAPMVFVGCTTPVSQRQVEVKTLQSIGLSAKASVDAAATLLKQSKISVAQWQMVADIFDNKFQPAFSVAVAAAHSDLSSLASPDLVALGGQIAGLVTQFTVNSH